MLAILIIFVLVILLTPKRKITIEPTMCPLIIEKRIGGAMDNSVKATLSASFDSEEKIMEVTDSSSLKLWVIDEIVRQCEEADFPIDVALKYAECESGFNPNAKNPSSSAKGVFSFIDGTWDYIKAEGHPFDYKENIKQFIKWFPKYPNWWEECN